MSIKITYFVHGTTADNEQKRSAGWNDVDLSEDWIENKSSFLAEEASKNNFDLIISSDLKRSIDTAIIIKGSKNIIQLQDSRLRECNYGDYNGELSEIVEPMQEQNITTRFPNGESYEDVKSRIQDFLNYLKENFDGKHVALVAHKAPQLALDHIIKGMSWEEAFANDWRKRKAWQAGWGYELN